MASGSQCVNIRWDGPAADVVSGDSSCASADTAVSPQGGVQMAAAMAAKINAMLMAKGKLKPLQPLPSKVPLVSALPLVSDEVIVAEVDINDVPINCRNLLTQKTTQDEIGQLSGAVVSTKGLCMSDMERCSGKDVLQPLFLHVQGCCQEEVNKAVSRIKEIISEDFQRSAGDRTALMPTVPVYRQTITAATPPKGANSPISPAHRPAPPHTGSFVHTKLFVGLERSQSSFNVKERVEGPSGSYLQHIQSESGARVFLRGRGSGYMEQASRRESFEPLYLYISHPNTAGLKEAQKLCQSLLDTVRADHAQIMTSFPSSAATPVYGYSSCNGQSWCSYPSSYSTFPFWSHSGQSQRSSGAVQYPLCSSANSGFLQDNQDAAAAEEHTLKQHCTQHHQTQIFTDAPLKDISTAEDTRTLMPPPATPVRKRQREETCTRPTHTDEEEPMRKMKTAAESSGSCGLVPYSGDSSDEEEERKSNI